MALARNKPFGFTFAYCAFSQVNVQLVECRRRHRHRVIRGSGLSSGAPYGHDVGKSGTFYFPFACGGCCLKTGTNLEHATVPPELPLSTESLTFATLDQSLSLSLSFTFSTLIISSRNQEGSVVLF